MPTRERSMALWFTGTENGLPITRERVNAEAVDVVGAGDNQPIDFSLSTMAGLLHNGKNSAGTLTWVNCPLSTPWNHGGPYRGHLVTTSQTDGYYAARVLARTNPSRSSFNALVSAAELREVPGLIRDSMGFTLKQMRESGVLRSWKFLKAAAKVNLMVQFGLAPLVSDCLKLPYLAEAIDARQRELQRMATRGLRRTLLLDLVSRFDESSLTVYSSSGTSNIVRCKAIKITRQIIRGHVRWYSTAPLPTSDAEMRYLARKAVTGAVITPEAIYEAMPWSWLVDYFTNVGDIVKSVSTVIPAFHDPVRIMRHTITDCHFSNPQQQNPNYKVSDGYSFLETKTRKIASPSLSAKTQLLQPSQLSILASLSVLKQRIFS